MRIKSVPLRQYMREHPEIGRSVIERHHLTEQGIASLHVTILSDVPTSRNDASEESRLLTMALLTTEPLTIDLASLGSTIKSPLDAPQSVIGSSIALARAVRKL